jgi:biopolymer transport protein ExbD
MNYFKLTFLVLIVVLFKNCSVDTIDLPKSEYFIELPKPGLTRNIFLQLRNGRLYHKDSLINDLNHFSYNLDKFIEMNDGSNKLRIVLSASKKTNYSTIDSVFCLLVDNCFNNIFIQTNQNIDSVGIDLPLLIRIPQEFWSNEIYDSLRLYDSNFKIVSLENNVLTINDSVVSKDLFLNECEKIVKANQFFYLNIDKINTYEDFVYLLDNYYSALYKFRDEYSISEYSMPYKLLDWNRKDEIDFKIDRKISFDFLDQVNKRNSAHNKQ